MISAIRLQVDLGLNNVLIIERATKFGGTWQWNQYPGG
jgi:cation diffusion facilitator CzcD-associated flavoprotein CzcO